MQVLHLTGKELDVGSACPDSLDVDNDPSRHWMRSSEILHAAFARSRDDERPHVPSHEPDQGNVAVPVTPTSAVNRRPASG